MRRKNRLPDSTWKLYNPGRRPKRALNSLKAATLLPSLFGFSRSQIKKRNISKTTRNKLNKKSSRRTSGCDVERVI
jgi:hypothetical protein